MTVKSLEVNTTSQDQDMGQEPATQTEDEVQGADATGAGGGSVEHSNMQEGVDATAFEGEDDVIAVSVTGSIDAAEQALILSVQHILALSGMAFSPGAVRDLA